MTLRNWIRSRAIADGNETVPTVTIPDGGRTRWAAVNPTAAQVVDAVRTHTPELLDRQPTERWWSVLRSRLPF